MKEQIVRYKDCDYRCYVKTMRRGKGRPYDRMICGKVDPKCRTEEYPSGFQKALMIDIRMYIDKSGLYGNTRRDVELAFISRDKADIKDALNALVEDGSIRQENGKYVTTDPRFIARTKQMRAKYIEQVQQTAKYIKPFPPPMRVTEIFGVKHFHAYKPDMEKHILEGHTIIGTPQTAILKTFRPELTAQLEKLQQKKFYQKPGSEEHEEFKDKYEKVFTYPSAEVEWKLAGMISAADTEKSVLTQASTDVAVFVDCKRGQIMEVNARYIHIVQDVCPSARYYSHGPDSTISVECDGKRVMVTSPMRISMSRDEQGALADVLCERL